jgi:hypothetical protein
MLRPATKSPWAVFSMVLVLICGPILSPYFLSPARADVSTGLIAYWNFENGSTLGTPFYGSLNLTNVGAAYTSATDGYGSSKGLALNGSAYLQSDSYPSSLNGNTAYTMAAWFKTTARGNGGIMGYGSTGTCLGNNLRLNGYRSFHSYWYGCDLTSSQVPDFSNNTWHHVAVTYDGTTRSFYYDGAFLNSGAGQTRATTGSTFQLGKTINDSAFNGTLDEVALYTRALSLADIQELRNGGLNYNASTTVSLSVAGSVRTVISRQPINLSAVSSVAGKVTFRSNGKTIPGCKGITTISLSATCSWRASVKGTNLLSAYIVPTAISSNATAVSSTYSITVLPRTSPRS